MRVENFFVGLIRTNNLKRGHLYRRYIAADWGLPRNLDAAFTWTNGKTYFFKRSLYWRYSNQTQDEGYPKLISKGFDGIPDNIDAAFVWSGNGKIYFFKGSDYWRFDPDQSPPVRSSYPRPISNWNGLPDNLDAALLYRNGFSYFFKGNDYWRFNDRAFAVNIFIDFYGLCLSSFRTSFINILFILCPFTY